VKGRKPDSIAEAANPVLEVPRAPAWLSTNARAEWRRIMPELVERRILTDADLGMVESYCLLIGRVRDLEKLLKTGFDPRLARLQDKAIISARQIAAEIGATPVSRARPSMRELDGGGDDNPLDF
jgi:P27 family predicted phage terminase small subunit